ncbi:hypothetical protein SAMN05216276_1008166 [Streptosporangium subroseum]|uniref:Uncharacterized protein n=1 Tax=Streptosporangium subroseum TaxID=106412 RepID=A0A239E2L4_9ACTN|nr:hypothetical protein [Streptosporangium subroseum]SNS38212.1 hypothetical protein SAMN05216276_1008166 [Streptosporangium subroseum]
MPTQTMVCDWFAPHEDAPPLLLTVTYPEGSRFVFLDDREEIKQELLAEFGHDYELDPDESPSDWIYSVIAFDQDVTGFVADRYSAHELAVTLTD